MNTNEPSAPHCPRCGAALAADATEGLCPRCLLALNLGPQTQLTGEEATGRQPAEPPAIAELAPLFPQLEILELLGRGGMGAVYRARQKQLDRVVALKILPPGIGSDPAFAARFATEARALAKLNHPNIVTIHDFGCVSTADTLPSPPDTLSVSLATRPSSLDPRRAPLFFFVMEFVDGMNLRQLMAAGRLAPREALVIVPQICDALQYAHDAGIVHRDIKPENILLDRRGRVKVADFGLAKLVGPVAGVADPGQPTSAMPATGGQTGLGVILGTPQYMAPEQREHPTDVDHRADIYSLGVVFYQMLTGELPKGDFAAPSKKVVVDVRLDEVVLRALEKNPELRYQHVSDVKTMCETIATTPRTAGEVAARTMAPGNSPKVSLCYISTPAHLRSFRGRFINIYKGKGELCLDQEALSFHSGWPTVTIPLASIRKLAQGDYPYSAKPVPLHFIAVTFEERGEERTLLFTPVIREVMAPDAANKLSDEWLVAIQAAFQAAIGRKLSVERSDIVQDKFWALKMLLALAGFCTVALWTIPLVLHQRLPSSWSEWLPVHGLIMAPVITAMFLAMHWLQRWWARQPGRPDSPHAPLGNQAATCTGHPALPRKTGMTRILEMFFDTTFTSPLAIKLANISALGFLGSLGFLRELPGWERCAGFFGLYGLFGFIGAAFMVEIFVRATATPVPDPGGTRAPGAAGRLAYWAFAMLYLAVAVGVLITAAWLPERVATHFGLAGRPNGWMTRTGYLAFVTAFPLLLALFFAGISALIKILPARFCNIPNRDFWLAPERRTTTVVRIRRWLAGLLCLMTLLFAGLHGLTIAANRSTPPQLPMGGLLLLVIVFLLALMIWLTMFLMRFAEIRTAGNGGQPPSNPSVAQSGAMQGPPPLDGRVRAKRFGKLALTLCLGGFVLPVLLLALRLPPQTRLGALLWIGAFGITSLCEIAAIVLGIMGWKSGAGKAAVIVAAVLPFVAVPGSLIAFRMVSQVSQERWLAEEERSRAYREQVETMLRNETIQRLGTYSVRCDHLKVIASPAGDLATILLANPQELRGVGGSNVWTNMEGLLTARPKGDGCWEVRGDQQLGHIRFTVMVPVIERLILPVGQAPDKVQVIFHGDREALAGKLRAGLVRQLVAGGASCADLQVAIGENLDNATVSYRQLQNFTNASGAKLTCTQGGFMLRPDGHGLWLGQLGDVPLTVRVGDVTLPAGAPDVRSWFPKAAHIGRNAGSVFVHHDDVDLHYVFFYAGLFNSHGGDSYNTKTHAWLDTGSVELNNGRKFLYLRLQVASNLLRVNGEEFNLEQGRVLVLRDDGTAGQLKLFPTLAVAQDPQALASLIATATKTDAAAITSYAGGMAATATVSVLSDPANAPARDQSGVKGVPGALLAASVQPGEGSFIRPYKPPAEYEVGFDLMRGSQDVYDFVYHLATNEEVVLKIAVERNGQPDRAKSQILRVGGQRKRYSQQGVGVFRISQGNDNFWYFNLDSGGSYGVFYDKRIAHKWGGATLGQTTGPEAVIFEWTGPENSLRIKIAALIRPTAAPELNPTIEPLDPSAIPVAQQGEK